MIQCVRNCFSFVYLQLISTCNAYRSIIDLMNSLSMFFIEYVKNVKNGTSIFTNGYMAPTKLMIDCKPLASLGMESKNMFPCTSTDVSFYSIKYVRTHLSRFTGPKKLHTSNMSLSIPLSLNCFDDFLLLQTKLNIPITIQFITKDNND